jgi:alpha-glucan,water dikinase
VISTGRGGGRLETVESLESVQGKRFAHPVVILAERVSGYEEIPEGVTAILTPDGVDVLSHLAIRARNGRVLFATCYREETAEELRSLKGQEIRLTVNESGDVMIEKGEGEPAEPPHLVKPAPSVTFKPRFRGYAVSPEGFEKETVGQKSLNLIRLASEMPPWISVPRSVAVPFGVFEKVRTEKPNHRIAEHYERLMGQVAGDADGVLEQLKGVVLSLEAPPGLMDALCAVMEEVGLPAPGNLEEAWSCIKRVWASTWNRRAYLSRRARGLDHEDLHMAVLIQEVVEAEYGFVIHTANPFSGNRDELYAEVVLGLGETLVSNRPGSALRVLCRKEGLEANILAYPSKSFGLYGKGLIFRSDSSGEDLAGYAGAGLYDSFLLEPPAEVRLDYADEPLVRDKEFVREFTVNLARIGQTVEDLFDVPQDIEGASAGGQYSVVQSRPQVGFEDE